MPPPEQTRVGKSISRESTGVGSQKKPSKSAVRIYTILYSICVVTAMPFLAGSVNGFTSPALVELTKIQDAELRFDTTLSDLFGASSLIGAVFGAPIGGYIADRYGRKTSLMCNTVPYTLGYFMIIMTSTLQNGLAFKILLITSRLVAGIGQSWSLVVVSIYIGEIIFAKARGLLVTIAEVIIYAGALTMLGIGSVPGLHYYHLAVIPIFILLIYIIMATWIPETPRWLLLYLKDKPRAISAMKCLKGPTVNAEKKLEIIQTSSLSVAKLPLHQVLRKLFCQKENLIPFVVAAVVLIHQQTCGFLALLNNIGSIFLKSKSPNPDLVGFLAGLSLIPGTLLCSLLVDIVGRKVLLAFGVLGMSLSQAVLGFQFYFTRPQTCYNENTTVTYVDTYYIEDCSLNLYHLAIASVIFYLLSYSLSIGPIATILVSEYLPLQVKGIANGILWSFNRLAGALIVGTFLNFSKWAGDWTAWWTLSFINLMAFVAFLMLVVETKGKKLEEIPTLFRQRYSKCLKTV